MLPLRYCQEHVSLFDPNVLLSSASVSILGTRCCQDAATVPSFFSSYHAPVSVLHSIFKVVAAAILLRARRILHRLCVATIWSHSILKDVSAEMLSRVFRFCIIIMLLAFTMNSEISTRAIERLRRLCRSLQVTIQLLSGSISVIIDDTAGLLSRARRHFHS